MRRLLRTLILILVASFSWQSGFAQKEDPRLAKLMAEQVERMIALSNWCENNKLFRERNRLLDAVIDLAPNNQFARRETGWERLGKKKWQRVKGHRRSIRTNPELAGEWKVRALALLDFYVEHGAPKLDGLQPLVSLWEKRRLATSLQVILPKHEGLRQILGEKKVKRRWLLEESVGARNARRKLADWAKLLIDGSGEPAEVALMVAERKVELDWKKPKFLPGIRVCGTVPQREIDSLCKLARATLNFVRMTMRSDVSPFQDFNIIVLSSREEADVFFAFYPGVTDTLRRNAARLSSCWVGDQPVVVIWPEGAARRKEWVARQTVSMLLRTGWNITTKNAVLFEGLGIYLAHKLTKERTTWYVRPSRYDRRGQDKSESSTLKKTKDWLRLARRRLTSTPPKYRRLFALDVNQMLTDDLLDSYVFAAFLVEAAREKREAYLLKIGSGMHYEHAVAEVWGMDVPQLRDRVLRWLKETKSR